jgi:hypothetical protein
MPDSTDRVGDYAAHIKPGDAVQTPDEALWVVDGVREHLLLVTSAFRDREGVIHRDLVERIETALPPDHVAKVADARDVG